MKHKAAFKKVFFSLQINLKTFLFLRYHISYKFIWGIEKVYLTTKNIFR